MSLQLSFSPRIVIRDRSCVVISRSVFVEVAKWLLSKKIDTTVKTKGGFLVGNTAGQIARWKANKEKDAAKKKRFEEIARRIEEAEAAAKTTK